MAWINHDQEDPSCVEAPGTPIGIQAADCEGARNVMWMLEPPNGSAATIANLAGVNTTFTPDLPGIYRLKLCCFFETENQVGDDYDPFANGPIISCPLGVFAGDEAEIALFGCNGSVNWSHSGGNTASIGGNNSGAVLTTQDPSPATIFVLAQCTDLDGNTTTVQCEVGVLPPTLELVCSQSQVTPFNAGTCGVFCECTTGVFFVKGGEQECETVQICVNVKDCTTIPEPDPC